MEATQDSCWVCQMADALACEILEEMSQIQIKRCASLRGPDAVPDTVCGVVDGDYQMKLLFRAEPRLFCRLAENMIGARPESADEVQEYACEFFNTLCGRFISEIYQVTHIPARFYPVYFEPAAESRDLNKDGPFSSVYFVSDQQEYAEFSWSKGPMEKLLGRSQKQ